jgi:hypothetical protein
MMGRPGRNKPQLGGNKLIVVIYGTIQGDEGCKRDLFQPKKTRSKEMREAK